MYSWIPFFRELGQKVLAYESRQLELIGFLRDTGVTYGLFDKDAEGNQILLTEIEPFTFFAQITKFGTDRRISILSYIKEKMGIASDVPSDFAGVPSANAQASWFFVYKAERAESAIPSLWRLAREVVKGEVQNSTFDRALSQRQVGKASLSDGMFCLNPEKYLPVDRQIQMYLRKRGINPSFSDFAGYMRLMSEVQKELPDIPFHVISHQAYVENQQEKTALSITTTSTRGIHYWLYAPGEKAKHWDEFYEKGIMALGFDELGDLSQFLTKEAIDERIREITGDTGPRWNDSLANWEFANVMSVGDIVIAKKGRSGYIGYGVVTSDYFFAPERQSYQKCRNVEWKKTGFWPETDAKLVTKTLTDITKYTDYIVRLKALIGFDESADEKTDELSDQSRFFWINANPKIWSTDQLKRIPEISYSTYGQSGGKRHGFRHMMDARAGDKVILYETTPVKKVKALLEVKREAHVDESGQEVITLGLLEFFPNQPTWEELKSLDSLKNAEPIRNNQGSVFKLTHDEYEVIVGLATAPKQNTLPFVNGDFEEPQTASAYTREELLADVFITPEILEKALSLLRRKKNLILQGPPGTGKTFFAKRLAWCLMGVKDQRRIQTIQFHQSYAYEDFIQGYRPEDGTLKLKNGVFFEFASLASIDSGREYVLIIDEINRGNLSKIFGELMLLIEADKRRESVQLAYGQSGERFSVPDNLYIIGTMNTADRSLAMVDYALRRRFAFVNIEPNFGEPFRDKLIEVGLNRGVIERIRKKLADVNQLIEKDPALGKGFLVGHSYFVVDQKPDDHEDWLREIFDYEVLPLLEEYWFDNEDRLNTARQILAD